MDVNFTAKPIAFYKPFKESTSRALTVYELETRDLKFLNKFKKQIKNDSVLKEENNVYYKIALSTLDSIIKSLKIKNRFGVSDKSAAYIAVNDKKITSLIQGNLPKVNLAQGKIVYSARNLPKESELDWLATIPTKGKDKVPTASAPAVVAELFNYIFKLPQKIKSVYCSSVLPENCEKSLKFYEKIGFKAVGNAVKMESSNGPVDLNYFTSVDSFKYYADEVLPMVISKADAKKAITDISKKFDREEIKNAKSVDLNKIVI